jgi:hypothetical protein
MPYRFLIYSNCTEAEKALNILEEETNKLTARHEYPMFRVVAIYRTQPRSSGFPKLVFLCHMDESNAGLFDSLIPVGNRV